MSSLSSKPHLSSHMDRIKSFINNPEEPLDEIVYNRMVDFVTKYQNLINDSEVMLSYVEGCITLEMPRKQIYVSFPSLSEISEYGSDPIEITKFNYPCKGIDPGHKITESEFSSMF